MSKKIAVIGSGISGLVSAYILSKKYDVSIFEANAYLGGHTNTVSVEREGQKYNIDTGFIVFNKKTYPNFCKLLQKLNVPIKKSEMSFSYRSKKDNFEYNGRNLNTLFSDRRNLLKPEFYRFLKDILLFNRDAKKFLTDRTNPLRTNTEKEALLSIKDFIDRNAYSAEFIDYYLIPMMSAIWSKNKADTLACAVQFIFEFYANHGFLDLFHRPQWYVVAGGSERYISPLVGHLKDSIYLNTPIKTIERKDNHVILKSEYDDYIFDCVVIATHSDQALKLLLDPTESEVHVLSKIKYTKNEVVLHTDSCVMPKKKLSWASWNYFDAGQSSASLTYYMNRLQNIKSNTDFFVSMNLTAAIDTSKIIQKYSYAHPCFDLTAVQSQQNIHLINGFNNTYYAGSYWGYGFHEDGVNSAIKTCQLFEARDV